MSHSQPTIMPAPVPHGTAPAEETRERSSCFQKTDADFKDQAPPDQRHAGPTRSAPHLCRATGLVPEAQRTGSSSRAALPAETDQHHPRTSPICPE
jgi:hypothetical protein